MENDKDDKTPLNKASCYFRVVWEKLVLPDYIIHTFSYFQYRLELKLSGANNCRIDSAVECLK